MHGLNSRGMQLLLQLHARAQLFRTQPAVLSRDLCPCTACTNGCRSAHDHRAKKCELCWCRICMGGTGGADFSWHAGTLRKNPWRICMDSAGSRCRVELLAAFCLLDFCLLPPWGTDTLPPLSFLLPNMLCDSVCLRARLRFLLLFFCFLLIAGPRRFKLLISSSNLLASSNTLNPRRVWMSEPTPSISLAHSRPGS